APRPDHPARVGAARTPRRWRTRRSAVIATDAGRSDAQACPFDHNLSHSAAPSLPSWPGLSRPSRSGEHIASIIGMRETSPRMTPVFAPANCNGATYKLRCEPHLGELRGCRQTILVVLHLGTHDHDGRGDELNDLQCLFDDEFLQLGERRFAGRL